MRKMLIPFLMAGLSLAFVSDKPAYRIYNQKGKDIPYSKMVRQLADADIIFFGELHDNPIAHWLQRELTGVCIEGSDWWGSIISVSKSLTAKHLRYTAKFLVTIFRFSKGLT